MDDGDVHSVRKEGSQHIGPSKPTTSSSMDVRKRSSEVVKIDVKSERSCYGCLKTAKDLTIRTIGQRGKCSYCGNPVEASILEPKEDAEVVEFVVGNKDRIDPPRLISEIAFDGEKWSEKEAAEWVLDNGLAVDDVEYKQGLYKAKLVDSDRFEKWSDVIYRFENEGIFVKSGIIS